MEKADAHDWQRTAVFAPPGRKAGALKGRRYAGNVKNPTLNDEGWGTQTKHQRLAP